MGGKAEGCHITPHKDTTLRKQKCLCSPENGINIDAMDKNVLQMVSSYEILFDRHISNPFSTEISLGGFAAKVWFGLNLHFDYEARHVTLKK